VIGPRADSVLRDWYGGQAPYVVTPRQGIAATLPAANILYAADDTSGAAAAAASAADVAVVFVGNHPTCGNNAPWGTCPTPYDGREAVDRTFIELEPTQETLVEHVVAANPRTIVVLVSSYPIAIGWINDHVPAILHVTNSSQELGTAIADALFGAYNPGGRTTTTWYRSETDIPTAITDYDIREGMTYWYFTGTPLYPFGHGLSYSTFAYANATASAPSLSSMSTPTCGAITIGVDVTNTGAVPGDEVAQLYISYPGSAIVARPLKQLRGFQRVSLAAGETRHVTFSLSATDLRYWDAGNARYAVETGMAGVQIGASSADIRAHVDLRVDP
jgi:beta-glucosidase